VKCSSLTAARADFEQDTPTGKSFDKVSNAVTLQQGKMQTIDQTIPPDEEGIETPSNPAALPRQGRIQSIYPSQEVFDKVSNAVTLQHGKMQTIAVRIEPLHPTRKEQKELSNAAALAQQGQNLKLSRLGRN
jgi:hypothetical protein